MLLIPYRIETLLQELPWANWVIIGACCIVSFGGFAGLLPAGANVLILSDWNPAGLFGHMLLHGGFSHLAGNMIFLWVFGNAVCGNVRNIVYIFVFPLCGLAAASVHLLIDGRPAIGASGAINGIVGFILVMYPLNRVHVLWWFLIRAGSFSMSAWSIILIWLAFDIWGAISGTGHTAYWSHIGGLATGVILGLVFLKTGLVQLTEWDNRSLLEILSGTDPQRRAD
jgi:membrane associated rhomboid family serine protease